MDILLFGIQGSGKGTQADKLAEEFKFVLYQPGVELRKIMSSGTPLGKTISQLLDKGNLAPLGVVMEITKMFVGSHGPEDRILFDGIPRDEDQRDGFNTLMRHAKRDFRCINIVIPEDVARERIFGRAKAENRSDDQAEEAVHRRFEIFKQHTLPIIDSYRREGKLTEVDGLGTVDEVFARMKAAVETIGN